MQKLQDLICRYIVYGHVIFTSFITLVIQNRTNKHTDFTVREFITITFYMIRERGNS